MTTTIYFFNGNNESSEKYYFEKEYRDDIVIKIDDLFYELYFFTQDSIEYEMTKDGYFSLPGLIILDSISLEKIIKSIKHLKQKGYFDNFKGTTELSQKNRFLHKWYENNLSLFNDKSLEILEIKM